MKLIWLFCLIFTISISGESLSEINNNINESGSRSSSSSNRSRQAYYSEQSGYNTDVQILGSEERFERVRFVPSMFDTWVRLYVSAQSYDLIAQLKDNGYVNMDGTLKPSVSSINVPLTPYKVINYKEISHHYKNKYTSIWIFDELVRAGILDAAGFLTNTESFSDAFNVSDFDQYKGLIASVNFKFSSTVISEEMKRELLRLLQESSMSIKVTQQETTRYQSRKEGFFESFLDQLGGNILGGIFYKDKVSTVKQKLTYSPNINVLTMFTNIQYGFSAVPYKNGAPGNVIFYGANHQNTGTINYSKNDNDIYHVGADVSLLVKMNNGSSQIGVSGINVQVNELRDSTGHTTWMSARFLAGQYGVNFDSQLSFGLSNYTSSYRGDSQLGLAFGITGTYHLIQYLGVYYGFDTNFGFNLFAGDDSDSTTWSVSRANIGFQTAIAPLRLHLGYEWVFGQQGTIFEGYRTGVGVYF